MPRRPPARTTRPDVNRPYVSRVEPPAFAANESIGKMCGRHATRLTLLILAAHTGRPYWQLIPLARSRVARSRVARSRVARFRNAPRRIVTAVAMCHSEFSETKTRTRFLMASSAGKGRRMRPWLLEETNYDQLKRHPVSVAVLPLGATEPHNLHLPYGTDTIEGTAVAERACKLAGERGANVIMLPAIPYGTETNMARFPLAMNLHPSTILAIVRDLCGSLADSGIRKLVLVNSHGGNEFKPLLRELANQTPVKLFLCDWFRQLSADLQEQIFEQPEDHAGEMETSMILALRPELVARHADGRLIADDGTVQPTRFQAVNAGWVSISRPWHLLTTNSGSGNPHAASAEKGNALLEGVVPRLADFLVELAAAPLDDTFPF